MVSETGQQEAEGFVKVSWERGRRTAMMNGEIMVCFFTEWMKEKDEPDVIRMHNAPRVGPFHLKR